MIESRTQSKGGQVIVSLNRLAQRLKVSPDTAKGMAWGIGGDILPVGTALAVDDATADRLAKELKKRPIPVRNDRRPASARD